MKRILMILLSLLLITTIAFAAGNLEERIKTTEIQVPVQINGMQLEDLLTLLSKESGTRILATPEVAGIKIDLELPAQQTLAQVFEALRNKYSLEYKMQNMQNAIIVLKNPGYDTVSAYPHGNVKSVLRLRLSFAPLEQAAIHPYPLPTSAEEYKGVTDNGFRDTLKNPTSTFSIDVDTASYSNVRRFINTGMRPLPDAVRTEELLNYFTYDYQQPNGSEPFSITTEVGLCPWQPNHKLVLIGLQGKNIDTEKMPPSNLVFLIDTSGSMIAENKLPLLKTAFKMLVNKLRAQDKVAVVAYANSAGVVLKPTPGSEKEKIIEAIDKLQAGGSTAGGEGIQLAYKLAKENYLKEGNNRVILATDGDFNVGVSSENELTKLIEEKRNDGIFLSVLGFGMGNIKDNKMEILADKGNGNYAYIDSAQEAKRVMVGQMAGTLYTIAKDVKLQVEFNPDKVKSYRLIGYENRALKNEEFSDDKTDAGDMGAGHNVTALYEIVPQASAIEPNDNLMQVKIRYKKPEEATSNLLTKTVSGADNWVTSDNLRFAAAVAEYGMLLRNSEHKGQANYKQVLELAKGAKGIDEEGYRSEFIRVVEITQMLGQKD